MSEQKINISLVEDCQKLLDKLIVHLDGLDFRDAKYIAGRLIDEIDKRSKVSINNDYVNPKILNQ